MRVILFASRQYETYDFNKQQTEDLDIYPLTCFQIGMLI